jgi:hypothetical protein
MVSLILLIGAFVLFLIAAYAYPAEPTRSKLCCIAFACWVAAEIVLRIPGIGAVR